MTARTLASAAAIFFGAFGFAGCANDTTGMLTTQAVNPAKASDAKADPACATLASQIEVLRKDTAVATLEKAAEGKSKSVDVKRSALAKQAELNKANADFQTKCLPAAAKAQSAQAAPSAAQAAPTAAAQAKSATVAKTAETVATGATAAAPATDAKQAAVVAAKDAATTAAKDAAMTAAKDAAAKKAIAP